MKHRLWAKSVLCVLPLLVLLATSAAQPAAIQAAAGPDDAWEQAHAAGSYRVHADIEETLIPRALPELAGEDEIRMDWQLEGEVRLPDQAVLTLHMESGVTKSAPASLIQSDGRTFISADGELREASSPLGAAAPTADLLAYLAGARNIQPGEPRQAGGESFTVFTFDFDGAQFARALRGTWEREFAAQPPPAGVSLEPPESVQRMTGRGELWVDARGLPRREVMQLSMPEASESYDARLQFVADFTGFGEVAALPRPEPDGRGGWQLPAQATGAGTASATPPNVAPVSLAIPPSTFALFMAAVFCAVLAAPRRREARRLYASLAWLIIASMVLSPVLEPAGVSQYMARRAEAAAQLADPLREALGAPTGAENFNLEDEIKARRLAQSSALPTCGDGVTGEDHDNDDLTDREELCLGTDPYTVDTDEDGITDTVEINGFEWPIGSGRQWTTDPLKVDSNGDGQPDLREWPAPIGTAVNADLDGDTVPNVWDDDDDGDGVPDYLDLSPQAVSDVRQSFNLHTQGGGFSGYEYIELQVQPADPDHWRFSLSPLDWPEDDKGQITDLDNSAQDLRLTPLLAIKANVKPNTYLAGKYGVIPAGELYVPLLPQSDGGKITSFYAKVAYAPGEYDDLQWDSIRFLWAVQGYAESWVNCSDEENPDITTCDVHSESTVLQFYEDPFRLTGLQIGKQGTFEVELLATPEYPTDDTNLFMLQAGMNTSFLHHSRLDQQGPNQTALQEIEERFLPGSGIPLTYTWGVTTSVALSRTLYAHQDEAIALIGSGLITGFLDTNFPESVYGGGTCSDEAGNEFRCASVLLATEQQSGGFDLSGFGTHVTSQTLSLNLAGVPMLARRTTRLSMYERGGPGSDWNVVDAARLLEIVDARYYDDYDDLAAQMSAEYGDDFTPADIRWAAVTLYVAGSAGQTMDVSVNGVPIEFDAEDADITATAIGFGHIVLGVIDLFMELTNGLTLDAGGELVPTHGKAARVALGVYGGTLAAGQAVLSAISIACLARADDEWCEAAAKGLEIAGMVITGLGILNTLRSLIHTILDASKAGVATAKVVSAASKATVVLAVVGLILDVGMAWSIAGLLISQADGNWAIISVAIANAVMATIWAVVLFVLTLLVPIGTIVAAVLAILDAIVSIVTMAVGCGTWSISRALVEIFYSVRLTTTLDTANFTNIRTGLKDPAAGMTVSNTYVITDTFVGVIVPFRNTGELMPGVRDAGSYGEDDLGSARVMGVDLGRPVSPGDALAENWDDTKVVRTPYFTMWTTRCTFTSGRTTCTNETGSRFTLRVAKPDVALRIDRHIDASLTYRQCGFWGTVCLTTHHFAQEIDIPDTSNDNPDDDEPLILYVDVLPNQTVGAAGLFDMPGVTTPDRDGDGVPDDSETPSCAALWDCDADGLSDGFETDNADRLGLDLDDPDSDDDGLYDGLEVRLRTDPDDPDSDDDGLLDGEEVYHQNLDLTWSGGFTVTLPGGRTVLVSSDPMLADGDRDNLTDGMERDNHLSPYARNGAPRLKLQPRPFSGELGGLAGFYATSGQAVTLTISLESRGPEAITTTLAACFPSATLASLQGGQMQGDRQPATQTGACAGGVEYAWPFTGANKLQLYEAVSTTVRAVVPALAGSAESDITLRLPYQNKVLTATVHMVVDNDDPAVKLTAPADGALLRGDSVVVRGTAGDPTSWVQTVAVNPGGGPAQATGTRAWAWTWPLPEDGVYVLAAQAYDYFGHTSPISQVMVTVDNTPPEVTLVNAGGYISGTNTTVPLTGTVSDNRSGVARVQVSTDYRPWRTVEFSATTGTWSYDWYVGGPDAQGKHVVAVRAFDLAGNVSDTLDGSVIVDRVPPTDDVLVGAGEDYPPYVQAGQVTTLTGYLNDTGRAPLPAHPEDLAGNLDTLDDATVWVEPASVYEDDAGVRLVWIGDYNGDARADLAVGLPAADGGAGRVHMVYGRGGDWPVVPDTEALDDIPSSFSGLPGAGVGALLAPAGDVNGDGLDDLLVGDPAHNRVFLIFGHASPGGPGTPLDGENVTNWSVIAMPAAPTWVAPAGDVNGDGFADVLVGAGGYAYLIAGRVAPWPATVDVAGKHAARVPLAASGVALGVGDVNGDQLDDFIVSNPASAVYLFAGDERFAWGANVVLALAVGANNALAAFGGTDPGERAAALGDVNGDGLADFIYSSGDAPRLVVGRTSGAWTVSLELSAYAPAPAGFLAAPGDVDADGLDDILLGVPGNHTAYLLLGSTAITVTGSPMPAIQATLERVSAAASAPYAAGADVNCDASSDLLVVPYDPSVTPLGPSWVNFGDLPYIHPDALPVAPAGGGAPQDTAEALAHGAEAVLALRYVDDDYCAACPNDGHVWGVDAFATIQAAVDASVAGDQISVRPGVYAAFEITATENLQVEGVNPDAVFIDASGGPYAVRVAASRDVHLVNLTLRDAERGVWLDDAGVGGNITPTYKIVLDHLVIHDFTNALYLDRVSTADVVSTTIAGRESSGAYLYVEAGADPAFDQSWTVLNPTTYPTNWNWDVGSSLVAAGGNLYALPGSGYEALYQYDEAGDAWEQRAQLPAAFGQGSAAADGGEGNLYALRGDNLGGGVNGPVYAVATNGWGDVYVGGKFTQAYNGDGTATSVSNIAMWNGATWSNLGGGVSIGGIPGDGAVHAIVVDGSTVYVGGDFDRANGTNAGNLALWNGASWRELCGGTDGRVQALALDLSGPYPELYVGGSFLKVNVHALPPWSPELIPSLAELAIYGEVECSWNGVGYSMESVPQTGWNGPVQAILLYDSYLYVGGNFTLGAELDANHIARYSGGSWQTLGSGLSNGLNGPVYALSAAGCGVAAGGSFGTAGGASANNVACWDGSAWSALGSGMDRPVFGLAFSASEGALYAGGTFNYALGVPGTGYLARWDGAAWSPAGPEPGRRGAAGPVATTAIAFDANSDRYVGGWFNTASAVDAANVARSTALQRYEINIDTWWTEDTARAPLQASGPGAAVTGDGGSYLYVTPGGGGTDFMRLALGYMWFRLAPAPAGLGAGSDLVYVDGYIYALRGGLTRDFYRYDVAADRWWELAPLPDGMTVGPGGALAWDGRDFLYALRGNNSMALLRYRLSTGEWESLGDIGTGFLVGYGSGLATLGNRLYAARGNGFEDFRTFAPVGLNAEKLTLDHVAFVAPGTLAAPQWLNLSAAQQPDFEVAGTDNVWVGGVGADWSPWKPATADMPGSVAVLPYDWASFLDPTANVYRVQQDSVLAAGYHAPHPDAYVSPSYCAACWNNGRTWGLDAFSNLQPAIDSGALRVRILPGTYAESVYLVSGITLIGAGADQTVIQPPAGMDPPALVTAEGVPGVTIARVTLNGDNRTAGVRVEDGAIDALLMRSIVRGATTGVRIEGADTDLEITNNTFAANGNGVVATGCASIDVRNTIFAFHSAAALSFESCAATLLHRYNLYWTNLDDFRIDGTPAAEPGLGEIFADPRFVDAAAQDYHLSAGSAAIDTGSPSDPVPPGTGGRIDIGYIQFNQASFYVDDDYCQTCLNDGLEWQVDAFDTIQDALDAAADDIAALGATQSGLRFTVGVAAGEYLENVTVPSYVSLVGVDADEVVLTGGGTGSPVTFAGAVQAEMRGFTITGAGSGEQDAGINVGAASNQITITHCLVRGNPVGIRFAGGATGAAGFNTLVQNSTAGVLADGAGTWISVRDNIVASNGAGLATSSGGTILNDYNLVYANTVHYQDGGGTGLTQGAHDLVDQNPHFVEPATGDYGLREDSPAVDAAETIANVPSGGGALADLGYKELLAVPMTLLFGREGNSCAVGNSGAGGVETGLGYVADPSDPITATLPTTWYPATLGIPGDTASYWTRALVPAEDGLYRVYTRGTDQAGNRESDADDWYEGVLVSDSTPPVLTWVAPADGTTTTEAAIDLVARASDYVTGPLGVEFSVDQVYFKVDGMTIPAQWDDPDWDATTGEPREFRVMAPLSDGVHVIQAFAVDKAGNKGQTSTRNLTASTPAHVATITSLQAGQAISGSLLIYGYARYTSTAGEGTVTVYVDGADPVAATLDDPYALLTAWSAAVTLPGAGSYTLSAAAARTGEKAAARTESDLVILVDTAPPDLAVTSPAPGMSFTRTVTLAGTASDSESGLSSVEVAFDGGYVWSAATLAGTQWSFDWEAPQGDPYVRYPIKVRAQDLAGNSAVVDFDLIVDNEPPASLMPEFSLPAGTHVDQPTELTITWTMPLDADSMLDVLLAADHVTDTVPSAVVPGTQATALFDTTGEWYVHLSVRDRAGNRTDTHYGPWYAGNADAGGACSQRVQTIILDGTLDVAHAEWLTARERLDDDERADARQELYATWDGANLYLGWQGAWWPGNGTLWAYLDVAPGGSPQFVNALPGLGLPFEADYAVEVTTAVTGTLWQHTGGAWQAQGGLVFAHGASGGTEVRIPWNPTSVTTARLLAYAVDGSNVPWSVFPTNNPLAGPWGAAYQWTDPCTIASPAAGQPQGRTITLDLTSPQGTQAPWGPPDQLQYVFDVTNREYTEQGGLQLAVTATPGLGYESVEGAACTSCPPGGDAWLLGLDPIPAGATQYITVTGRLGAAVAGLRAVTTTATLAQSATPLAGATLSHRVDGQAPDAEINLNPEVTLRAGLQTIRGDASDGDGIGVALVEVRQDGGAWQSATGTSAWSIELDVPAAPTLLLEVRATDAHGNVGAPHGHTFVVDSVAPSVSYSLPAILGGRYLELDGTAYDAYPPGGSVLAVEVQRDSESWWTPVTGPYPPAPDGTQSWHLSWALPAGDGEIHYLRMRAIDAAGNVSEPTAWSATVVDTVAPVVDVTQLRTTVNLSEYLPGAPSPAPVLSITVVDGLGIISPTVRVDTPEGQSYISATAFVDGAWQFTPVLETSGHYHQYVQVYDLAGNLTQVGPVHLFVVDDPLAGLAVSNDGPTVLGTATTLTATVSAGTTITYTWDFADGTPPLVTGPYITGGGSVLHTYASAGAYDVVVVARNTASVLTATTHVEVDAPISSLLAVNDSPTLLSRPTTLTATVATGTNVVYDWAFGDGTYGAGAVVSHVYPAAGAYTAVVTASNSVSAAATGTGVQIDPAVDLALTLEAAPDPVIPGRLLTYTLSATNLGPSYATAVILTDTLPNGVAFVSGSPGCVHAGGAVSCALGTLPPAGGTTVILVVRADQLTPGPIINAAQVSALEDDLVAANNTATISTQKGYWILMPVIVRNAGGGYRDKR